MKQIHPLKTRSVKPAIADLNAAEAEANIRRKLTILTEALMQSTRPKHVRSAWAPDMAVAIESGALPTTIRQFNLWDTEAVPQDLKGKLPSFRRNAGVTLKRHRQLMTNVEDVITALRKALLTPTVESRREHSVASLRRRIEGAKTMRQIAERELVASRQEVQRLKDLLALETSRREATERESKEMVKKLHAQLAQARAQKNPSTVSPTKLTLAPPSTANE
ncbi:hypothetical protein [Variovorax sp. AFSI2.2]|uniref:hypothetical protein n=1 Tax=Variovorax sp. AFSI2.2 TaxID=3384160 RepID=UPI003EBD68FB